MNVAHVPMLPQDVGAHGLSSPVNPLDADLSSSGHPLTMSGIAASRFREMVDSNFSFIWRSLRGLGVSKHSVDDAAQQVFWIACRKLDTIAAGSERAFLFSTAIGVSANVRRAQARNREVCDDQALAAQVDEGPNPETVLEARQQRALLDQVLEALPNELRVVFILFVLEGATAPEVAAMLGIAEGTVASRVRRARKAFHDIARRIQARSIRPGDAR